jgi:hypothetical protein
MEKVSFEVFQKYFMDEFCDVFDYDDAMEILDKIGFPERERLPFNLPKSFWRKTCKLILSGRGIKGQSLHPLLDAAAKLCPHNSIFKNWRTRISSYSGELELLARISLPIQQDTLYELEIGYVELNIAGKQFISWSEKIPSMHSIAEIINHCCKDVIKDRG